jgi:hypothetical protein
VGVAGETVLASPSVGDISTVAGDGSSGFSGNYGTAVSASLIFLNAVALDSQNNLFIAEFGNSRVRRVDAVSDAITTVAVNGNIDFSGDGGSLSCLGRVLPTAMAVWAAAKLSFRQISGSNDFIEMPISVDMSRPMARGYRHEAGFEWPCIPSRNYDHRAVVRGILKQNFEEGTTFPTYVINTHQDQDYADPLHPASLTLQSVFQTLRETADEIQTGLVVTTIADMVGRVRDSDVKTA